MKQRSPYIQTHEAPVDLHLPEGGGARTKGEHGVRQTDPATLVTAMDRLWAWRSTLGQQGTQADLVQDALAGEGFGEHTDHEAEHGGAAVEQLNAAELLLVDLGGSCALEPGVAGAAVGG